MKRTGSYPLKDIAQDFSLAYRDVLIWADYLGYVRRAEAVPPGRFDVFAAAIENCRWKHNAIVWGRIVAAMVTHADKRWGRPPVVHV